MCCFVDEMTAAFAGRGSTLQYDTDADAEERLRLKTSTKTAPMKKDRQSLTRQNAAAHEKDDKIAQSLRCHVKRKKFGITRHRNYKVEEETSKGAGSRRRRYHAAGVCGRRSERFLRYKRDRCCGRSSKRNPANCQRNRSRNCEEAQMSNVLEEFESQSVDTATQHFSNDEYDDEVEERNDVNNFEGLPDEVTTAFCEKCESSKDSYFRGKEMQTISEEDLISPDDPNETMIDSVLEEINDHEEDHRTSEYEPRFYSRTLNQTTWGVGEKLQHPSGCCARHKCSRCSRHTCYNSGDQSVTEDYIDSSIATTRSKGICPSIRPCMQGLRCPYNNKISLDAFRSSIKKSTTQSSILWKVAAGIYEISGILKDALVKLLAQDEETERSSQRARDDRETGWKNSRNVETGVERSNCANNTQNNNETFTGREAANLTDKATDCTTHRHSANCKISTGRNYYNSEKDSFETSCGVESPKGMIIHSASVSCTANIRKNTFTPKPTCSESSISNLSSSASLRYSSSATESGRVEKEAENYCRRDSTDCRIFSGKKSTLDLNKRNLISPVEFTNVNKSTSQSEDLDSYDEIDAPNSTNHPLTDIGDIPGDVIRDETDEAKYVSLRQLVEPEQIYKIEEPPDPSDRPEYWDKNKKCLLQRERVGKESWESRNGKSFRNEIYYNSHKASEVDSATSSNCEYDCSRKRKLKLSARVRHDPSLSSCQECLASRNYAAKKVISKTDSESEQPYETFIQSHLEYFKEIELEDATLELTSEPPCSKIPRLIRHGRVAGYEARDSNVSYYNFVGAESSGARGESQQWEHELLADRTEPAGRRRKRINTCHGAPRSFRSTSHHFYI